MSVYAGPEISQSNLVFAYDMGNDKSWKGAPTTNLLSISSWNSNLLGTSPYWESMTRNIITTNLLYAGVNIGQGITASVNGSGFGYLDFALPTGTTAGIVYACSFWYKSSSRTAKVWCHDTAGLNAVETAALPANDKWNRGVVLFTSTTSGAVRLHFHVNNGSVGDIVYFTAPMIEQKAFGSQFAIGTRSSANSILDLTGSCVVTNTELTYNSDTTFKFDGVNDYATISTFTNKPTTQITFESWIKPTKASVGTGTIRGASLSCTNSTYLGIIDSSDGGNTFSFHWANQTTSSRAYCWLGSVPNNAWSHMVGTYDGVNAKAYLNGKLIWTGAQTGTIPDGTYVIGTYGGSLQDGVHNFNGSLDVGRIYNRALTDTEIRQNFNALRGRFGI